jgi:hypothetical protein
MDPKTAIVIC